LDFHFIELNILGLFASFTPFLWLGDYFASNINEENSPSSANTSNTASFGAGCIER